MKLENLVFEAMVENLLVAKYCIEFRKDVGKWKREGCYGYPAAILLFSIADMIGSYILGGTTKNHFNILNDKNYYNLEVRKSDINELYGNYRCLLTHNGALPLGRLMDIGSNSSPVLTRTNSGDLLLNLVPFWNLSHKCVETFLQSVTFEDNSQAQKILNIPAPII